MVGVSKFWEEANCYDSGGLEEYKFYLSASGEGSWVMHDIRGVSVVRAQRITRAVQEDAGEGDGAVLRRLRQDH